MEIHKIDRKPHSKSLAADRAGKSKNSRQGTKKAALGRFCKPFFCVFMRPWHWAYHETLVHLGAAQFVLDFYSVMLTSTVLGFITIMPFKPRSWCVYCPIGTMTQLICKMKHSFCSQSGDWCRKFPGIRAGRHHCLTAQAANEPF